MTDIKLVVKIPEELYKIIKDRKLATMYHADRLWKAVANGTPLTPDMNATNGDMILTMFDTATVYGIDEENDYIIICIDNNFYQKFRYSWWNAPYKRGSEDGI